MTDNELIKAVLESVIERFDREHLPILREMSSQFLKNPDNVFRKIHDDYLLIRKSLEQLRASQPPQV